MVLCVIPLSKALPLDSITIIDWTFWTWSKTEGDYYSDSCSFLNGIKKILLLWLKSPNKKKKEGNEQALMGGWSNCMESIETVGNTFESGLST